MKKELERGKIEEILVALEGHEVLVGWTVLSRMQMRGVEVAVTAESPHRSTMAYFRTTSDEGMVGSCSVSGRPMPGYAIYTKLGNKLRVEGALGPTPRWVVE